MPDPFTKTELKKLSSDYPNGISSQEIVQLFRERGFKFSEATFRKYVQMGLVERCRRVGRKGKHRGSRGLYPISTIERINTIKRMISGDMTLEQLRGSYFQLRQRVEEVDRILMEVQHEITRQEEQKERKDRQDAAIRRDVEQISKTVRRLIRKLETLENAYLPRR